ncbi:unnamed protein product [Paramecium octaurelia]|uniref:Uncharacterized protein n=1 Tax=Paramecium octaurelia TaxID=43137 RepID=A0A8S1VBX6_PAROT|nr:unnamed protein product [Paramecium octaurelia]
MFGSNLSKDYIYNQQQNNTSGCQINISQLSHSYVRFPLQSSIMSVEEQSPQFVQFAQSQIYIQENQVFQEEENHRHQNKMPQQPQRQLEQQAGHKRMTSWQQQKSPQQQSQSKSLCASPLRQQYRQEEPQMHYHQPYQPCPCELEQLWQEFLQMRMMQRQFSRPPQQFCHHQRCHFMPY